MPAPGPSAAAPVKFSFGGGGDGIDISSLVGPTTPQPSVAPRGAFPLSCDAPVRNIGGDVVPQQKKGENEAAGEVKEVEMKKNDAQKDGYESSSGSSSSSSSSSSDGGGCCDAVVVEKAAAAPASPAAAAVPRARAPLQRDFKAPAPPEEGRTAGGLKISHTDQKQEVKEPKTVPSEPKVIADSGGGKFCAPLITRPTSCICDVIVMNVRGDLIVTMPFRMSDVIKKAPQVFYQWHSRAADSPCPVVTLDGTHYIWIERDGLIFVTYTRQNVSPSFVIEFLHALARVMSDFLGELSECAMQRNRHLVYEIMSEVMDFGWPQTTHSEYLKTYIYDEPVVVEDEDLYREVEENPQNWRESAVWYSQWAGDRILNPALKYTPLPKLATRVGAATGLDKVAGSATAQWVSAAVAQRLAPAANAKAIKAPKKNRPIVCTQKERVGGGMGHRNNKLFVDVIETLSVMFNQKGEVEREDIVGRIVVKSYIPGQPMVKMALNNNLYIKKLDDDGNIPVTKDTVMLQNQTFDSGVHVSEWEAFRTIKFQPPEGEYQVMSYKCAANIMHPFKVYYFTDQTSAYQFEIVLKVRADLPESAKVPTLTTVCPLPAHASKVGFEFGSVSVTRTAPEGQECEWSHAKKTFTWKNTTLRPGSEAVLRAKVTSSQQLTPELIKRGVGPIGLRFEVTGWVPSKLNVQYVRLSEDHSFYRPDQYMRYVCKHGSYVQKVDGVRMLQNHAPRAAAIGGVTAPASWKAKPQPPTSMARRT